MRAASDWASLHILHSLARAFADCTKKKRCRKGVDEGSGQIVHTRSFDLPFNRICEQQMIGRACNAIKRRDVNEGTGQIVYTSSCDLGTYRICEQPMIRRACTFT